MRVLRSFLLAVLLLAASSVSSVCAQNAKYVFYFIGDGMGMNQVLGTEYYLGELSGKYGIEPLCFAQFPYTGLVTTYSASTNVTDSSAAGTALSTGNKTANNVMGMLPDKTTPVESIAAKAHRQGKRVAICSTVSIDHATPAVFYAHSPSRDDRYVIGHQLSETGYEFFAGGDFGQNTDRRNPDAKSNTDYAKENGYTIVRGMADYKANFSKSDKMILLQKERADGKNSDLVACIDRQGDELSLCDITTAAIDFMMKDPDKGFFVMLEGGQIDHWAHGNDAASTFHEVIDFDNAIKIAYDFYLKHKDETLIVVTADHETGGISLGNGAYRLNLKVLENQKISEDQFARHMENITKERKDTLSWDEVKSELTRYFGFFDKVRVTTAQEDKLKEAYLETFGSLSRRRRPAAAGTVAQAVPEASKEESYQYYKADKLSDLTVRTMCDIAQVGWGTGEHSGGYVPVFAIGAGADSFTGQIDNTEIPVRIAAAAGISW